MKKYYSYLLFFLLCMLTACSEFDSINTNPDATTKVKPWLLATGQLKDMMWISLDRDYFQHNTLSKHISLVEHQDDIQYNRLWRAGFGAYQNLTNCFKMVEMAENVDKDAYQALAKFIIAYRLYHISLSLGDIPYSEAFKGEQGIVKPKYDTQKDVMIQILEDLDKAYTLFSNTKGKLEGDIIFNGDLQKWKKTVTAMQLKVLISLSKKESDADMNIKQRFANIVSNQDLMESNADNFQLTYGTEASKICPLYKTKNLLTHYIMISDIVIDTLRKYDDYRLFYYGKPSKVKLEKGHTADDWDAYTKTNPVGNFTDLSKSYSSGDHTGINLRYTEVETGEPLIRLGYAQQNFILAEACLRGWISGNANDYYLKGIKASMKFIVDNTPNEKKYHNGRPMTDTYIASFLANPDLQLTLSSASFEKDLNKVITQKYLTAFMQHPWESYYEYRRTGYPRLPINPATNLNTDPNKMPMRWMYEQAELDFNRSSYDEAIKRQFGGSDDVNQIMWILK